MRLMTVTGGNPTDASQGCTTSSRYWIVRFHSLPGSLMTIAVGRAPRRLSRTRAATLFTPPPYVKTSLPDGSWMFGTGIM
jgi:hypothetical protein